MIRGWKVSLNFCHRSHWKSKIISCWNMSFIERTAWHWFRYPIKSHYQWLVMVLWLRPSNKAKVKSMKEVIVTRPKKCQINSNIKTMLISFFAYLLHQARPLIKLFFGSFKKTSCLSKNTQLVVDRGLVLPLWQRICMHRPLCSIVYSNTTTNTKNELDNKIEL